MISAPGHRFRPPPDHARRPGPPNWPTTNAMTRRMNTPSAGNLGADRNRCSDESHRTKSKSRRESLAADDALPFKMHDQRGDQPDKEKNNARRATRISRQWQ